MILGQMPDGTSTQYVAKFALNDSRSNAVTTPNDTIRVWDPIVRIGHWTLVIAFFTAYLTEDDFLTQHVWAGYVVGIVVCVRLLWGVVGTKHARFVDFVKSPALTLRYIVDLATNRAKRYIGHNPAAGAMVIALLISLSATVISGLMVYAIEENAGPLASLVADYSAPRPLPTLTGVANADADEYEDDDEREDSASGEFWEEFHEIFANLTLLLVGLHIAGVLYSSYLHKENLIRGMITGRKRRDGE
jgi:cytochrome b